MKRLKNKKAVVTGGASGIGKAIVERFIDEGAKVVIADIDENSAKNLSQKFKENSFYFKVDVSLSEEVKKLISFAELKLGGLDIMVNNAGIGAAATVEFTDEKVWDNLMNINLKGTFLGMKYSVPAIRRNGGGSIINISSIAALVGLPERAAYSAAKGGIVSLTKSAAIDYVSENIRINCIAPGTTDTPWIKRITDSQPDPIKAKESMLARQPHGRLVTPEEIAAMAAYLASDEAASIIGAVMVVDGGMTAR
ncbi:MAG: glucose 1-dehydrogenase [Ignavibacteriales bacterium]|nr:MAG: glucose 1-dehydrogenase [Ignavibacteriales bacterium]